MKKVKKGISVIIPTFNRKKYLYPTLLCLSNQKLESSLDYEVIVIDSGNDGSDQIVKYFKKNNLRRFRYKKIRRCSNRSLLRNKGAALAKYDLLFFIDNDMLLPPSYLQSHYEVHKRKEPLIVCGRRKTLTDFNIDRLGEKILLNYFSKLELLPWYDDERIQQSFEFESWRFVYTHSLSISNKLFKQVGGFTNKFGNVWGGEDIEFAYKLFQKGASFFFLKEPVIYHQGHFLQSSIEQQSSLSSSRLFSRLHNSYNSELFLCYPTISNSFLYEDAFLFIDNYYKTSNQNYPKKHFRQKFDLILGFAFNAINEGKCRKIRLGLFLPQKNKSVKRVLILSAVLNFPRNVQDCILSEAIRVTNNIYFEITANNETILEIFERIGYKIIILTLGKFKKVQIESYKGNGVIQFTLPDLFSPQKRFVYFSLAAKLQRFKKRIILRDKRNSEFINDEDLSLESDVCERLNKCFRLQYGSIPSIFITSFSNTVNDSIYLLPDIPQNFIIHDEDYILENCNSLISKYRNSIDINNIDFSTISFCETLEAVQSWKEKNKNYSYEESYILIFMENGYYEDSIDKILSALYQTVLHDKKIRVLIKTIDYKLQIKNAYPFHNDSSRKIKIFDYEKKILTDKYLLMNQIKELHLEQNIEVLEKNFSFSETINLIAASRFIIQLSKIRNPSPEIYAGRILKKTVIIPEHYLIPNELNECFIKVKSEKRIAADVLHLPLTSKNLNYYLFEIDEKHLIELLRKINIPCYISSVQEDALNKKYNQIIRFLTD